MRNLTIKESAEFLETDISNVYKLIREGILTPLKEQPLILSEAQLFFYLNTRIPSHLKVYYSNEKVA